MNDTQYIRHKSTDYIHTYLALHNRSKVAGTPIAIASHHISLSLSLVSAPATQNCKFVTRQPRRLAVILLPNERNKTESPFVAKCGSHKKPAEFQKMPCRYQRTCGLCRLRLILSLYTYLATPFSDTQIGKLIITWL